MQVGDKVLVPRTSGDVTPGVIVEVYGDYARVRFEIGDYYRGLPTPPMIKGQYGYKTLKQSELKAVEA